MNNLRICEKTRYETADDAEEMKAYLAEDGNTPKLRVYKCHACHNWHLTSKRERRYL